MIWFLMFDPSDPVPFRILAESNFENLPFFWAKVEIYLLRNLKTIFFILISFLLKSPYLLKFSSQKKK